MTAAAEALLTEYQARPVRAVQLTEANAELLGTLPGLEWVPETDDCEWEFNVCVEARYTQGIDFGDWIVSTATPDEWMIYWGDDIDDPDSDFKKFSDVFAESAV